jgi:hypothetical protein
MRHINVMPAFSVMRRVKEEEQGRGSTIAINGFFLSEMPWETPVPKQYSMQN